VSAAVLKYCEKYPMPVYEVRTRKGKSGVDLML
jgi:hypothetical protein